VAERYEAGSSGDDRYRIGDTLAGRDCRAADVWKGLSGRCMERLHLSLETRIMRYPSAITVISSAVGRESVQCGTEFVGGAEGRRAVPLECRTGRQAELVVHLERMSVLGSPNASLEGESSHTVLSGGTLPERLRNQGLLRILAFRLRMMARGHVRRGRGGR
jgi:hypothetical protein